MQPIIVAVYSSAPSAIASIGGASCCCGLVNAYLPLEGPAHNAEGQFLRFGNFNRYN